VQEATAELQTLVLFAIDDAGRRPQIYAVRVQGWAFWVYGLPGGHRDACGFYGARRGCPKSMGRCRCRPLCLESEPSTGRVILPAAGTTGLPQLLSSLTGRFPIPPELLLWWAHEEPSMGRRR
jgi:hypothetical protein